MRNCRAFLTDLLIQNPLRNNARESARRKLLRERGLRIPSPFRSVPSEPNRFQTFGAWFNRNREREREKLGEVWIQSLKHEALDHFVVFGLDHFDHIVREFIAYYHACRLHQGIGNRLIGADEDEKQPAGVSLDQIKCETRLGGLLKHYYRVA